MSCTEFILASRPQHFKVTRQQQKKKIIGRSIVVVRHLCLPSATSFESLGISHLSFSCQNMCETNDIDLTYIAPGGRRRAIRKLLLHIRFSCVTHSFRKHGTAIALYTYRAHSCVRWLQEIERIVKALTAIDSNLGQDFRSSPPVEKQIVQGRTPNNMDFSRRYIRQCGVTEEKVDQASIEVTPSFTR